jgi:hypothetical protein
VTGKLCVLHFIVMIETLAELVISEVKSRPFLGI